MAVKVSDNRGDVKREKIDEGSLCRPVGVPPKDSGIYRNRDLAGGAVWGILITLSSSLRRFTYSIKFYFSKRY